MILNILINTINWILAVFFCLLAIASFQDNILSSLIFISLAAIFIPNIQNLIKNKLNIQLKLRYTIPIGFIGMLIGAVISVGDSGQTKQNTFSQKSSEKTENKKKESEIKIEPISNAEKEKKSDELYKTAFNYQANNSKQEALEKYKELQAFNPGYKDIDDRVKFLEQHFQDLKIKKQKEEKSEKVYKTAFDYQANNDRKKALEKYKEIQSFNPGYKDVSERIKNLEKHFSDLKKEEARQAEAKKVAEEQKWTLAMNNFKSTMKEFDFIKDVTYYHDTYIGKQVLKDRKEPRIQIMISNDWHYEPEQIRKQVTQNLWKIWSMNALNYNLVQELDHARITVVDYNNNEVGGSRALAGSLIWVNK